MDDIAKLAQLTDAHAPCIPALPDKDEAFDRVRTPCAGADDFSADLRGKTSSCSIALSKKKRPSAHLRWWSMATIEAAKLE